MTVSSKGWFSEPFLVAFVTVAVEIDLSVALDARMPAKQSACNPFVDFRAL